MAWHASGCVSNLCLAGWGMLAFVADLLTNNKRCRLYLRREDFDEEAGHFRDPVLCQVLPAAHLITDNSDGFVRSGSGMPFPPFIVLERGITLADWGVQPRKALQVIGMVEAVAELLVTLHASGKVHRVRACLLDNVVLKQASTFLPRSTMCISADTSAPCLAHMRL